MKRWMVGALLVLIVILTGCVQAPDSFDGERAWDFLAILSDESQNGRMPGTPEHDRIAKMIAIEFEKLGLLPDPNSDQYLQSFTAYTPELNEPSVFEILNEEGQVKRVFRHREDYAEITSDFACGGSVVGALTIYRNPGDVESGETTILLLPDAALATEENLKDWIQMGVQAVVRPSKKELRGENQDRLIKSVYLGNQPITTANRDLMMLAVKDETMKDLIFYAGAGSSAHIELPLQVEPVEGINVVGWIEGTDAKLKNEPILVTAHYDHVGSDPDGSVYSGTLDNASGVAALLELARCFADAPQKRPLIFVAFDAEESGLQGSKKFAYHAGEKLLPLETAMVINLDMIGSAEPVPLTIATAYNDKASGLSVARMEGLIDAVESAAKQNDVPIVLDRHASSSDHMSFLNRGVPAVTLSHFAMEKIHTPEDTLDNCKMERMAEVGVMLVDAVEVLANRRVANEAVASFALSGTGRFGLLLWILILGFLIYWRIIRPRTKKVRVSWLAIYLVLSIMALLVWLTNGNQTELPRSLQVLPWNQSVFIRVPGIQRLNLNTGADAIHLQTETGNGIASFYLDEAGNRINEKTQQALEPAEKAKREEKSDSVVFDDQVQYGYTDEQGRTHLVMKREDEAGRFCLMYQWTDLAGGASEPIVLAAISKDAAWCFAMDQAMGIVLVQEKEQTKRIRFPLGLRAASLVSVKPLEVHERSGALISLQEIRKLEGEKDKISFLSIGKLQTGESMVIQLDFEQGEFVHSEVHAWTDQNTFSNIQVGRINEYEIAAWIEPEKGWVHLKSANPLFGFSAGKTAAIMAITSGIESLVQGGIVMLSRLLWLVPGALLLLVWAIRKEQAIPYSLVTIALISNWTLQVLTFNMPNLFGLACENWILSGWIALLVIGILWIEKLERGRTSPIRCFLLFTILNLFFISILYAPALFQQGEERIKDIVFYSSQSEQLLP